MKANYFFCIFQGISDVLAFTTFNLYFPAILVEFILAALIDGRQRLLEVSSSDKVMNKAAGSLLVISPESKARVRFSC